jgi:hypothetical protein
MASWAALPVLSGFRYDARAGRMELAPLINRSAFRCFWSAPTAWGSFELSPQGLTLTVTDGSIALRQLKVAPFHSHAPGTLNVSRGGSAIAHQARPSDDGMLIEFSSAVEVTPSKSLRVLA